MIELDRRIAKTAEVYFNLGVTCYKSLNKEPNLSNWQYIPPCVVNLSFSIELYLKSMIDQKKIHFLDELLEKIPEQERETIVQITIAKYGNMANMVISEQQFWEKLVALRNSFQEWRYFYQYTISCDVHFLYSLASTLMIITKSIEQSFEKKLPENERI